MKSKIFKISVIIALVITLTMTNFIFLGSSIISYAADNISTNHKNVEFDAYFKDSNGQKTTILERTADMQDISLYLYVNINTEGFFNGKITLSNANFTIVNSESGYVSNISDNTINLNQINVGTPTEIEVKIKPIDEDILDINMLDMESDLTLTGIYRDNTEKDINIEATRTVNMQLAEENTNEDIKNNVEIITNKVMKISGEDKRVLQLSLDMGLNENNYPIKEIYLKVQVPEIDGAQPEVLEDVHLNTMSAFDYKYEDGYVEITLKNEETANNCILWRKQGEENVILTYIYDADVELENIEMTSEERVTLYNNKELNAKINTVTLSDEEIDSTIEVTTNNLEESMYKGKLYSGIDKEYTSETTLDVNLANIAEYISIREEASKYVFADGVETDSSIYYNSTLISKEDFDEIFGTEGVIEIYNENGEQLAEITNKTNVDADGNIVIDYTGKEPTGIGIRTSTQIKEGSLVFTHTKTIRASDINVMKATDHITTKVIYGYNQYDQEAETTYSIGTQAETEANISLEETVTEAKLEINRDTLSTIVANDIEIKLILKTDEESRDLYKNPSFTIELPEQVESVQINHIDMLYEEELRIANYQVNGRHITIQMEGEQTNYKSQAVEGANIIINATINVNRTSIAKPETINVTYTNEKANAYANNEEIGRISQEIEVVAPKDVTVINSIEALNVETIGEEETTSVSLQRGTEAQQLEVHFELINNNEENVENVYMLGTFPTRTEENNIDIAIINGITIDNAKIYYTENENATTDIENSENGWSETIENPTAVKKYLIVMDKIDARTSVSGTYRIEIPENLEYNQMATEGYEVTYTRGLARSENTVKATTISMETGVGPKVETNLTASVAGENLTDTNTVKNGEVITYRIQVSNTGSEAVNTITVRGEIPEGTTLVEPVDNYEYTGASYYKEVEADNYETVIENLAVGDVTYVEYQVMVNAETESGTTIACTAEISYLDVIQETNTSQVTSESGNLSSMVKRVTDRQVDLYEAGTVSYFAIIKNISSETIEDAVVKTNKSDNLDVSRLTLISGMSEDKVADDDIYIISSENTDVEVREENNESTIDEDTTSETIEYSDEIHVGTLNPGEVKVLSYNMVIKEMPDNEVDTINFSVVASDGNTEHRSNVWEDKVNSFDIDMTMTSNTESRYVQSGNNITYTIQIRNNSTSQTSGLVVRDEIPSQLTIQRVTKDGEDIEFTTNTIEIQDDIQANSESTITIETVVNYSDARVEAESITNRATASIYGEEIATTSDLNHIIEADIVEDDTPNEGGNSDNTDDEQNGNIANGEQMISGLAWFDENHNGRKDDEEETLQNITVKLLNVETNSYVKDSSGNILEAKTNDNGMYVLDNIANGQYIVIFEYDENQYTLTTYKAEGISEAENSDVRQNELLIEGERQEVASTDIIRIDNENIADTNIGLSELQNFDLKLDKYISRILVQNSSGTTTREYGNSTTAKIELDAKEMSGSTVIIEYNIVVTNVGEVAGYARNIVDYMPSDLEFSSELNKDWYESGNTLHTSILGNEIINPGESKTVTLTLTKTMGEDNLVTRNQAEIYQAYNDLGLEDGNSTPGNNASGENDMGYADVIISIRTGGVVYMSIGITIAIIVLAGVVAGIIVKRKNHKEEE